MNFNRYVQLKEHRIGTKIPKLRWAVPRWSYQARMWRELRRVLNARILLRIAAVSTLVGTAFVILIKFAIPNLVLPNLWPMLLALPGILLAVVAQMSILNIIPPFVTIRRDKIQYVHGQNCFEIKANAIVWIKITVYTSSIKRLKIAYARKQRQRILRIGVPESIYLDELISLLPVEPKIVDGRRLWNSSQRKDVTKRWTEGPVERAQKW